MRNTPSHPDDSTNSNNSFIPIRDPDDIENLKPNENNIKPIKQREPKTAKENDLSWVEKHPNWIYMKEPRNAPCGESISGDRIVGGTTAALGQHPWIARLGRYNTYNSKCWWYSM